MCSNDTGANIVAQLKTLNLKLTGEKKLPEKTKWNFQLLKTAMKLWIIREHDNYSLCLVRNCAKTLARFCCYEIAAGNIIAWGIWYPAVTGWLVAHKEIQDAETITLSVFTAQLVIMGTGMKAALQCASRCMCHTALCSLCSTSLQ